MKQLQYITPRTTMVILGAKEQLLKITGPATTPTQTAPERSELSTPFQG